MRDLDRFKRSTMWFFVIAVALVASGTAEVIVGLADRGQGRSAALGGVAIAVGAGVLVYGVREFRRLHQ